MEIPDPARDAAIGERTSEYAEKKTEVLTATKNIVYLYSGANMAGENLMVCGECGSLIKDENTERHTSWHQSGSA